MSAKKTVNLTPTMRPDVIGDIEKGNGVSVTSNTKIQVHVGSIVKGTTPQLVVDGKVVGATLKKATTGYTFIATNKLSEGTHTIAYKYKTTSGQVGDLSPQLTVTIDTTAPKAPSVAPIIYENANGGINASKAADGIIVNVSLKGTNALEGDVLNVMLDGVATPYTLKLLDILYGANVTVPKSVIDLVGQGTIPVTASITDAAKNTSAESPAANIVINTRTPNAPSSLSIQNTNDFQINADDIANGVTVDFSLKGTNAVMGDTVTVLVGAIPTSYVLSAQDIANKTAHIRLPKSTFDAIGEGIAEVSATITTASKNTSPSSKPISITVDTIAPHTPLYAPSVPENDKGGVNIAEAADGIKVGVVLSGTDAMAGDTIDVFLDAKVVTYTIVARDVANKQAVITVPKAVLDQLPQGVVNVSAIITDAAGNSSNMSAVNGITLRTTPIHSPSVSTDGVGVDAQTAPNGTTVHVALKGTNAAVGDVVNVMVNDISTVYTLSAQDISKKTADVTVPQFVLNAAGDGKANVNATLTDTAGNVSQASASTSFTISNAFPTFIENGSPVALFSQHRTGLEKSTEAFIREVRVQISGKQIDGTDQLTFTDSSKIHGSFDASKGELVLTAVDNSNAGAIQDGVLHLYGMAPRSEFESVLKTVKYYSTSENPTFISELIDNDKPLDTRTFDVSIIESIDGHPFDINDIKDQTTVNIVGVEDLPVITLGSDANFLVSADLPTDPTLVYSPDKLPYVNSGMNISDLDDPNAFGGLIRIANWNWKTDAFTLDMQDEKGDIKPVLFDVRTAANVNDAVDHINMIISNSTGANVGYGQSYEGLIVNTQTRYIPQGDDYGDGLLAAKGVLVNAENKATLGFLQIQLGYAMGVIEGDPHVYPIDIPTRGFSESDNGVNTGILNTLRIASNEVNVDRPVEFVITGSKRNASLLTQDESMKMSVNDVMAHFSGSTSVVTRSMQLDFTTNNAPVVSLLPNLDLNSSDDSSITLNTIAAIQDVKDSSIANESDHLQHASVTLYNVPESYEFYVAPLKASTQGKALMTQASVVDGVESHIPVAHYNQADKSWTIDFYGDDTPENYQAMLNRLTIKDPLATGTQTAQMIISLKDAANNGTASAPKVTTLKTTVNLGFPQLIDYAPMDDEMMIPSKQAMKIADTAVNSVNESAPHVALTGINTHPVDAHLI